KARRRRPRMPADARTLAWVALARSAIPPRALVTLLRTFGAPEALQAATRAQLDKLVGPALGGRIAAARGAGHASVAELDATARARCSSFPMRRSRCSTSAGAICSIAPRWRSSEVATRLRKARRSRASSPRHWGARD